MLIRLTNVLLSLLSTVLWTFSPMAVAPLLPTPMLTSNISCLQGCELNLQYSCCAQCIGPLSIGENSFIWPFCYIERIEFLWIANKLVYEK